MFRFRETVIPKSQTCFSNDVLFWCVFSKRLFRNSGVRKACTKTSVIDPLRLRVQQRVRKTCTVGFDHPLVRCKADTALLPKQLQSFPCLRMNNSLQYIIKFEGWKIPWVGRGSSVLLGLESPAQGLLDATGATTSDDGQDWAGQPQPAVSCSIMQCLHL